MPNSENKNQLTLYRFVSLRSPELTKTENQEKRFVLHPDNSTGPFFTAVNEKPTNQTNWEAMENESNNFSSFNEVSELDSYVGSKFYKLSEWIAQNRSNINISELQEKINAVELLDPQKELEIWDNLFFQVITQRSFYLKEAIIQALVLQNMLKQISFLNEEEIITFLPVLANAKVVLPTILFGDQAAVSNNVEKKGEVDEDIIVSKELFDANDIQNSKNNIDNYKNLIDQLQILEKSYNKASQEQYNTDLQAYQVDISTIIKQYESDYNEERRNLCSIPRDEHYDPDDICYQPNIVKPEIPEFVFSFQPEFDMADIETKLSVVNFEILTDVIGLKEITTFQEAIDLVTKEITKQGIAISQKTITTQKTITVGDAILTANQVLDNSFIFPIQICSTRMSNGNISIYMTIQLPNSSYDISQFKYTLLHSISMNTTHSFYTKTMNGTVMTLSNLFADEISTFIGEGATGINGTIKFTNGHEFTFVISNFSLGSCQSGKLVQKIGDITDDEISTNFVPKGFGYKQLGIADYKKVVAEVCCYNAGEVAHIENVMASELRSKTTTKTFKSEITETESTEIERENITDIVSTERFEMQTEIANLLAEQKQVTGYANVSSSWGTTTLEAGGTYASNTTKEESNRQAVNQAKELTQRAMERITSRVKKEKTVKITNEFVEQNTHVFDNTANLHHVSGVFRFINAEYKNQIFNYGKRLMYEFMVPQPSKLHELAMKVATNNENAIVLDKPIDPTTLGITDFTKITETNYQNLASKYNAQDINLKPDEFIYSGKSFGNAEKNRDIPGVLSGSITIPENYKAYNAKAYVTGSPQGYQANQWGSIIKVNVGAIQYPTQLNNQLFFPVDNYTGEVPITIGFFGYHLFNATVTIKSQLSDNGRLNWQKDTFEKIMAGYYEQLRVYNEKLSEAKTLGVQILDTNPLFYRDIEQMVLRKNCISYLIDNSATSLRKFGRKMYTGTSISDHQIPATQDLDNYGSFVKFIEQSFEWNLMSYNFYPYYWGYDGDWSSLYQHETNDPLFRSFMQAGMARVVVTVKPGFEEAVMHYMTTGQIWNGGQTPILGDPLFLSIVDELKEQEYTVEETWKTVVPTHLIALQKSGVSVDEEGLPCSCPAVDELNNQFAINDKTLMGKTN